MKKISDLPLKIYLVIRMLKYSKTIAVYGLNGIDIFPLLRFTGTKCKRFCFFGRFYKKVRTKTPKARSRSMGLQLPVSCNQFVLLPSRGGTHLLTAETAVQFSFLF